MFASKRCAFSLISSLTKPSRGKHSLPDLPYPYDALQPVISKEIMEIHHTKHHATYISNLNSIEDQLKEAISKNDTATIIKLSPGVRFNGGGHINHSIFWQNLSPNGGKPSGELCEAITRDFQSVDNLKSKMAAQTNAVQGSGWGWLGYNPNSGKLQIVTCGNQDPLFATTGIIPLFGIDVWEHAYYLQYKNVRADYTKAIFDIANWNDISKRFSDAKNKKCN